jgi:D-alanyl-D-alanine carboxypeptidase/D-alanyl-D-alanine-endopeptidase (penicillin-binding protein 4)
MFEHPRRDMFLNNLAGNRTGGRLKKRLAGVQGDVYAKTGYMRGVRTLSGYVKSRHDRWYAFSVLFNGFRGSSGPYNKIHTKLCRILADS